MKGTRAVTVKTELLQKDHSLELSSKSPIVIEKAFSLLHLQQDSKHRNIKGDRSSAPPYLRLTGRHFPSQVPPRGNRKCAVRRCFVCQHTTKNPQRRKESRYMCKECDKGLCVYPCFEAYHSELNF
ncbi:piggyBac transposable element-derived protein 4 [Trichonephila inaurata madagascariensis]|uniref:PiggyBac transposable element-derived protein 4 n=1 Tax=Trichonephila inaurata madagascariensis TaxID=2747483 RepID=A0A8X6K4N5_9ARAC|nr:piggyBac transposable element-derived protein 4 [Trichonephila inaurata madagascariensis]